MRYYGGGVVWWQWLPDIVIIIYRESLTLGMANHFSFRENLVKINWLAFILCLREKNKKPIWFPLHLSGAKKMTKNI